MRGLGAYLPVRPQMPTLDPGVIFNVMSFRASESGLLGIRGDY